MGSLIPDTKIQEVRERVDMIALVQRHGVELKKSGRSYKGLCPFHEEKSPSFYVWSDEKRFKCFGCQASGDAISFVQRLTGKSFVEAVRDLAEAVGVDLSAGVDVGMQEKQQLKVATDFAAVHFSERLCDPAVGRLRPIAAHVPPGLTRSALFGAMSKHFGLPASELESALCSAADAGRP